jgi:hypothetical protein
MIRLEVNRFHRTKGIQMRKFLVIAAIALMSGTAHAGPSRTLSLAASETEQPVPEQPKTEQKADTPAPAEAPLAVERPKLVAPQDQAKTPVTADKPEIAVKPKKKRASTEARVIYELHRHGVYW